LAPSAELVDFEQTSRPWKGVAVRELDGAYQSDRLEVVVEQRNQRVSRRVEVRVVERASGR